ncbi:MAG: sensor histidine kinase N-terminal domain-containing protein [Pseudomonadota bacterium]
MLPLTLTWLAGSVVTMIVANYFTQQAFDRAMLDDAYSISVNVRADESGRVQLLLTPREVTAVLFDQTESVFFAVLRPDGSLLSGHAGLHPASPTEHMMYRFSDVNYQGKALRAVALHVELDNEPYQVVVAQTTRTRTALLSRLLVYATLPQTVLMLLLAAWLWRGIARDLAPLNQLQNTLDRRDASDLSPVPVPHTARELQSLGTAVNALFGRLDRSVRAQRQFAGNVAHELRTPLAGIRALADYGLANGEPEVWRQQLVRIATSQARASHLVDQLLALALADEADAVLQRAPVELDSLVGEAVLRHLSRADARGVDLGARGLEDEADFKVLANVALVEGILDNLIDNALRYGGHTITIELSGGGRTLAVVDDGPGITEAQRHDLLARWAQGPDGQKLGQGAGLGLAIVARYAQLLGSELTLDAAGPEGGLRAEVVLPRR